MLTQVGQSELGLDTVKLTVGSYRIKSVNPLTRVLQQVLTHCFTLWRISL